MIKVSTPSSSRLCEREIRSSVVTAQTNLILKREDLTHSYCFINLLHFSFDVDYTRRNPTVKGNSVKEFISVLSHPTWNINTLIYYYILLWFHTKHIYAIWNTPQSENALWFILIIELKHCDKKLYMNANNLNIIHFLIKPK